MAKRDRIMYASQSLRADGHLLYRVQTLGVNTTFTSEDIFEMGHLETVDVVDDVPAVAVTCDTNDFGSVETMAVLAGMNPERMIGVPTESGAYLRTNTDCTGSGTSRFYHGVSLADFTLCDGVAMWAPVQNEASFGTLDDNIEMTLFMNKVFVNSITLTYNVGANAAENFAAETDNKRWLVNGGRFISQESWELADGGSATSNTLNLALAPATTIPELSDCKLAFLAWDDRNRQGVIVREASDRQGTVYEVEAGTVAAAGKFVYDSSDHTLLMPSDAATLWTSPIKIVARYAASAFAASGNGTGSGSDSDKIWGSYFQLITSSSAPDMPALHQPEDVGALRQGQVEVYLLDPDISTTDDDWSMMLRLQTVEVTASPARTPMNELGHLRPYARPMNFPVEITTRVTANASDLELFATFAGKTWSDYDTGGSGVDLTLTHLLSKDNLILVVKVFQQTDDEAGGNGRDRKVFLESMDGDEYYDFDGGASTYSTIGCSGDRERPLKTVIVPGLKITAENFNNSVGGGGGGGANATQEFNFRSTNELYVVKGDVSVTDVPCIERNPDADQY